MEKFNQIPPLRGPGFYRERKRERIQRKKRVVPPSERPIRQAIGQSAREQPAQLRYSLKREALDMLRAIDPAYVLQIAALIGLAIAGIYKTTPKAIRPEPDVQPAVIKGTDRCDTIVRKIRGDTGMVIELVGPGCARLLQQEINEIHPSKNETRETFISRE